MRIFLSMDISLRIVEGYQTEKARWPNLVLNKCVWQWNGREAKERQTRDLEVNYIFGTKKEKCKRDQESLN